jgi:hypothetical protein
MVGSYDNALPWSRQNWVVLGPLLVTFLSSLVAFLHRVFGAQAQPVTGTKREANRVNAERTAEAAQQVAAATAAPRTMVVSDDYQLPPGAYWGSAPSATGSTPMSVVPIEQLPLVQIANELPQVVDLVGKVLGTIGALAGPLGAIGAVGGVLGEVNKKREPGTFS